MVGIKDFDMPSCCGNCQMASCKGLSGQFYCDITTYDVDIDDTKRDADCPLVEAIPKADYENRLKADMVAMLTELQSEIEETVKEEELIDKKWARGLHYSEKIIQQKIDKLKGESDGTTNT